MAAPAAPRNRFPCHHCSAVPYLFENVGPKPCLEFEFHFRVAVATREACIRSRCGGKSMDFDSRVGFCAGPGRTDWKSPRHWRGGAHYKRRSADVEPDRK